MNLNIPKFNINYPKITFKSNENKNLKNQPIPKQQLNKDTFEMSIGYVNDIHGQTNNMMRILSGIKGDLKLSAGDNDIGDEKNVAVHKATAKFMNIADIKASALGNHELDTTQNDCIRWIKEFNGEMLSVNYRQFPLHRQSSEEILKLDRGPLDKALKRSTIVEVKGEKIGLIGASPMDMFERLTHPLYYADSYVKNMEDTLDDIKDEVRILKEKGCNKIVMLSHLGNKRDKYLAQNVEDIDVIIGGHSHELVRGIKEGENLFYTKKGEPIIITQAGRDGNYFGKLNLTFNKDGVITKAQNNIGETRFFHKNMINQYVFDEILGKPEIVGYVKSAPKPPESLLEENPHANFVCDVMREETGADIALWQNAGARSFFHEGVINSREVKDMAPFLDYVVVANVSEKTLIDMFKMTIENSYKSSSNKPGLIAVSGLKYKVDPKEGKLVEMLYIDKNGNEHELDIENPSSKKQFKVVADEFLMSAGADFNVLATEDKYLKLYEHDKDYFVCEYLKKHKKPLVIEHSGRIVFEEDDD